MNRRTAALLVLGLLAAGADDAAACSCFREEPCATLYAGTANLFEATVTAIDAEEPGRLTVSSIPPMEIAMVRVHLKDVKVLMGEGADSVVTLGGTAMCGYGFKVGVRYLIDGRSGERGTTTSVCSFTSELSQAGAVLDYLASLSRPGPGATLSGSVGFNGSDPLEDVTPASMAGLTVHLTGSGKRSVTTSADGRFAFEALPTGSYTLSVVPPAEAIFKVSPSQEVVVADSHACVATSMTAYYGTVLEGGVVDERGTPLSDVPVVVRRAIQRKGESYVRYGVAMSGEFGRYRFDDLAPGQYVVGMNLNGGPQDSSPYLPTFVRNGTGQPEAIDLPVGGHVALSDLVAMPARMIVVQGRVAWPDAAAGATVNITAMGVGEGNEMSSNMIRTSADADGRFELTLAYGQRYSLSAFGSQPQPSDPSGFWGSDRLQIVAGETPIALVIRRQ